MCLKKFNEVIIQLLWCCFLYQYFISHPKIISHR